MCSRAVMIACLGDHSTQWIPCRGNEASLEVSGLGPGDCLKLVGDTEGAITEIELTGGSNPFPLGLSRFQVRKQSTAGAVGSPTTVKVRT
jgi:hypothetical protein